MRNEHLQVCDRELIIAARRGSEVAFRQLYEKYWNDLYRIASKRVRSTEDVKDILQETFLSLWKNLDHISVEENVGGYLYISLRNKILNYYEKNQSKLAALLKQPFDPIQSEIVIYNNLTTKELQHFVHSIESGLPSKMREIYLLSKHEKLTIQQIASFLKLSPQTVKNQIHQALLRIRQRLEKSNITPVRVAK